MTDAQGGSSSDGGNVPRLFGGVGVDVNQLFEDASSGDPQEGSRAGVQSGSGGQQGGAGVDVVRLLEGFQQQSQRMAQVLEQLSARMTQNETEMQGRLDTITAQLAQRQTNQQNVQPSAVPTAQATVNARVRFGVLHNKLRTPVGGWSSSGWRRSNANFAGAGTHWRWYSRKFSSGRQDAFWSGPSGCRLSEVQRTGFRVERVSGLG